MSGQKTRHTEKRGDSRTVKKKPRSVTGDDIVKKRRDGERLAILRARFLGWINIYDNVVGYTGSEAT